MPPTRAIRFTGMALPIPFLLSSAPPPESKSSITHAYEAGWGGLVVAQSEIRRPDAADYRAGYEPTEGYAGAGA